MITLCILADTHQKHRQVTIPPCDLLIHCGDFGYFGHDDHATLEDVDAWFAEAPADKVVCIGGNHDFMLQNREFHFAHAELLEDSGIEYCGLRIYGSPWCPELPGFAYFGTEPQLIEKWRRIPSGIDVLVTHTHHRAASSIYPSAAPPMSVVRISRRNCNASVRAFMPSATFTTAMAVMKTAAHFISTRPW